VGYGVFSLISALALFWPWMRGFAGSRAWALTNMAGLLPTLLFACVLLVQYVQRAKGEEGLRARVLLLALVVGVAVASVELWNAVGFPVPPLGNLGTLVGDVLLFAIATRSPRLDWRLSSTGVAIASVLLAAFGVTAYLAIFRFFGSNTALRALTTATMTFLLIGATRVVLARIARDRERLERLASVGRFASQLAHDLKNPLAALKGAAQFLKEEHAQGRPLEVHARFLDLMVDQTDRLQRVVEHYQRLGRVEPRREPVDANALVQRVLALQPFAAEGLDLRTELGELPPCRLDPDLVANAVENLVRNAAEAMPQGGTLTVSTGPEDGAQALTITVADTGQGMDNRTRERAFDDFFTTKATGSGLGLAFVRRVAEAHGGRVSLTTKLGKGTLVRMHLPLE
jgi:signal transduction histidine kinase